MENTERYTDRLAKYILIASGICLLGLLCWTFRNIIGYILIAVVVSLIAKPVMGLLKKPSIRGRKIPNWLAAAVSLIIVIGAILTLLFLIIPLVSSIVKDVSMANIEQTAKSIAAPLSDLNVYLRESFPKLGNDFRLEVVIGQQVQKLFNVSAFSSLIGSAASVLTSFAIGIFVARAITFSYSLSVRSR